MSLCLGIEEKRSEPKADQDDNEYDVVLPADVVQSDRIYKDVEKYGKTG